MPTTRKVVLESDLGNLQAFGVPDKDLRTIERSINQHKVVEMEEVVVGIRPVTTIFIDGVFFTKVEGY